MDLAAREARLTTREREPDESRSFIALLPPEMKIQIMSYISTQQSLSRLSQSCRAWYETAAEELYTRDAKRHRSFAIKWMAAHAVDEQTTDSALRTLETSRRWGGEIDAVKRLSELDRQRSDKDQLMYESSTALHFAIFLGNKRLTKTILDMEGSLTIPCPALLWNIMGAEEVLLRVKSFQEVFDECGFGPAFPIFLAFLQSDPDMCKLLIDHGAGREAMMVYLYGNSKDIIMSILHFAAVDRTTDYRQWQCLFDGFREYIDEPCPGRLKYTPLQVAMINGCTQGMQIAVESGAEKVSRNDAVSGPLTLGMIGLPHLSIADPKPLEEHAKCLRKFMDLRGSGNPDGVSLIGLAVRYYTWFPDRRPDMRHLIYFLLEYPADIPGTGSDWRNTNVAHDIVVKILEYDHEPPTQAFLKELLSDLVDRGLNLKIPYPGSFSPLYCVLLRKKATPEWLFDFLCENGATIHEDEVASAFLSWCETTRLWETNKYNAWWQHQGQEDEIFLKWCEHPYNAWWWQHVKQFSTSLVSLAYRESFKQNGQLYDILTHLPLPRPFDDILVQTATLSAFTSLQPWIWRLVVLREFEEDFLATWSMECGENMIHLTVRVFVVVGDYSAADAIRDILHLRNKGADMTSRNNNGKTPLEILLESGSSKDNMELVALLEGEAKKVQELA